MSNKQPLSYLLLLVLIPCFALAQANFNTSLHKTRAGKPYWYNAANGGFESLTNVPISQLGCVECHGPTNADGQPYPSNYTPSCVDCHPTNSGYNRDSIRVSQCYGCHGRQATEANQLNIPDVHRSAGMKCWSCHHSNDMHGTATVHNSMLEPGAMEAECTNCHTTAGGTLPDHTNWDPPAHNNKIHCTACHARTVLSCYNCHFESQVIAHKKRAKQPITGFVMLANRTKDGKVYPMSFQSVTYQGNAFVAFAPFTSHTIRDTGRTCTECHLNFGGNIPAIQQYNQTGQIQFATWNSNDSTLSWLRGVVPMPADYRRSFKMDFITYTGDPNDTVLPSKKWRYIGKNTWDGHQMFFATPLTKVQMKKLGFDTTLTTDVHEAPGQAPATFALRQNYPNPFNPSTTIEFHLPQADVVTLKLYNVLGAEVKTLLLNEQKAAGVYRVAVDAGDLPSGVYLYKISTTRFTQARKMCLVR
jgi:hypothetical protein